MLPSRLRGVGGELPAFGQVTKVCATDDSRLQQRSVEAARSPERTDDDLPLVKRVVEMTGDLGKVKPT
jgi:hypothetical protein